MDNLSGPPTYSCVGAAPAGDEVAASDGNPAVGATADAHHRDGVSALLHLLTRLANCGLDADAPPLLAASRREL